MELTPVAIYGAGGHARETAWLLQSCVVDGMKVEVVCFIEEPDRVKAASLNGIPVLVLDEVRGKSPDARVISGVGTPVVRRKLMAKAEAAGFSFVVAIHPRVERSEFVEVGLGTAICAGCILTTNIRIGRHAHINYGCTIGHDVIIDDFATLAPGVNVSGAVHIGAGAYIGTGASIINGTSDNPLLIGADAVVGAGACVVKSVPPGVTVMGVPARSKGEIR